MFALDEMDFTMQDDNPYAPPTTGAPAGPRVRVITPSKGVPGTVIAGTILIGFVLVNIFVGTAMLPKDRSAVSQWLPVILTLAVLGGIFSRHPAAWTASRSLAVLGSLLILVVIVLMLFTLQGLHRILSVASVLPTLGSNIAIYFLMSHPRSRIWFGVACPLCGNLYPHSAKFGFTLARCRECQAVWEPQSGNLKAS